MTDAASGGSHALTLKVEGNKLFQRGNYAKASEKYKEAIALDPTVPAFYSNLCICHSKLSKFEEMEVSARKCIALDNNFIKGHYWLAMSLKCRKMYRDAVNVCDNALEIDPSNSGILQ